MCLGATQFKVNYEHLIRRNRADVGDPLNKLGSIHLSLSNCKLAK
jgi:hypothetical protein